MKGKWTNLYHKYFAEVIEESKSAALEKLRNRKYETPEEIINEYSNQLSESINKLYRGKTEDGKDCKSWFIETLFQKFKTGKKRFEENYFVDGFIDKILPEIRDDFNYHYDKADDTAKSTWYYDKDYALNATNEEIIKLIATRNAYEKIIENRFIVLKELEEQDIVRIPNTKELDTQPHIQNDFNNMPYDEVLKYFEQLQCINRAVERPFLEIEKIRNLVDNICLNKPVNNYIRINIEEGQKQQIQYFFYIFYRYCKAKYDYKAKSKKYFELPIRYIEQFKNDKYTETYRKNFSHKPPKFIINVNEVYFKW